VFTPSFVPRLAVTLDYYRITKEAIIGSISRNFILAENAANGSYADRITRDPGNNSVIEIVATRANLLDQSIKGLDFGLQYETEESSVGTFLFRTDLTYLDTFEQSPAPGAPPVRRVGLYDDATGTLARLRGTARLGWERGGLMVSTGARYVGGVENNGSLLVDDEHLQADSYFQNDWTASYDFEGAKTKITLVLENVFDEMPPFLEGNFANGFDAGSFNSRGRYYMMRVEKAF
jgi:hypothetical protein